MIEETLLVETALAEEEGAKQPSGKRTMKWSGFALLLVAVAAAVAYYLYSQAYESTDNAFLEGNVTQVSPRVTGQIIRVYVQDNQHVNRGDLLAEIDPQDYEVRAAEARGKLADISAKANGAQSNLALTAAVTGAVLTQATAAAGAAGEQVHILQARIQQDAAAVRMTEASVAQAQAQQQAAEAEAERAIADVARYRALFAKDEVSKQQLDRAETQARAAQASRDASRQMTEAAKAHLAQARAAQVSTEAAYRQSQDQVSQAEGRVREAKAGPQQVRTRQADVSSLAAQIDQFKASVKQTELALSYTRITAPEAGYVTRKSVEPGTFVQTGQPLMALVSDKLWVVANFKETQLNEMRTGQPVSIKVDAYPGLHLRGHVESIQSGTGARFSLLPAENATGNYVKVVQRVPVKIVLDEAPPTEYRIGPGMSVKPEVKIR